MLRRSSIPVQVFTGYKPLSYSGSSGIASSISGGALNAVADRLIHQRLNGNLACFQNELGRFLESVSKIEKNRTSKRNFPVYLGG